MNYKEDTILQAIINSDTVYLSGLDSQDSHQIDFINYIESPDNLLNFPNKAKSLKLSQNINFFERIGDS